MAQKPFLALVIPAESALQRDKPDHPHGGPPGQAPGGPPGQQQPVFPTHPIVIEPPERPDVPEGSKLILVWDGEGWRWATLSGDQITQLPTELPEPK